MTSIAAVDGIEKLDGEALRAFGALLTSLGWSEAHGDNLASTIAIESRFDAKAVNPSSGASGLIQFMPATARQLGTTIEAVRAMNAAEQLELAVRYFAPFRAIAPRDVPLAVFLPKYIGAADDTVIATAGQAIYDQNAGLDRGADGVLTVGDVRASYAGPLFKAAQRPRVELPSSRLWIYLLGAAVLAGGAYAAYVLTTGQSWDGPIRQLTNGALDVRENPRRDVWNRVRRVTCGTERKKRRAIGREWADKPCDEARAQLRREAEQEREDRAARTARMTPAQRRQRRTARSKQQEQVEREARDLERHLEEHTDLPGAAIAQALREFQADPWPYFRRSKRSGGRTHPYEYAAEDAMENAGELIEAAQRHADRELRKSERRREREYEADDEPPF